MLHGSFSSTAKTPKYFLFKIMANFFSFSSTVCFLYIRVYDCFSVWSQKLKYESEGN